ncbi:hypothetical protein IAR55_002006 [Kwoniella newhampshirensis]|uniref:Cutinase n=1 Tax=Kwoniella newhampshirensis TaxID=1651941 RepID=A0AAW0YQ01_9TREE
MLVRVAFLLLVCSLLARSIPLTPRDNEPRATCPTYMVIEAPGLADSAGSWTSPTTNQLLKALPGGERYLLKTPPPSSDNGPNSDGAVLISHAAAGSLEMVQTVATTFATCPTTKIVIFGYSYGTIEAILALNDPALVRLPIAAVIMYGNCFWHAGRPENRGTATSGTSVCGQAEGLGTPITFEDVTADFCLANDYLCTGAPYSSRANTHWSYKNSNWQTEAVQFAVDRIKSGNNIPIGV